MTVASNSIIFTTMREQKDIKGKIVKNGVQQSLPRHNLNQNKNKQIFNKEAQKSIYQI